jgi:hypothetical protein
MKKTLRIFWFIHGDKEDPCPKYRAYIYDQFLREKNIRSYYAKIPYFSYKTTSSYYRNLFTKFCFNAFIAKFLSKLLTELSRSFINKVLELYHIFLSIRCHSVIFQRQVPNKIHEKLLTLFKCKIFLDIDDALFLNSPSQKQHMNNRIEVNVILSDKLSKFSSKATGVIVSNEFLGSWFFQFNNNIIKIPTSYRLPSKIHATVKTMNEQRPIIGWMGATENQLYLHEVLPSINKIYKDFPNMELHIITKKHWDFKYDFIKNIEWNPDTFYYDIANLDIAIAPLTDNQWCHGKMQFKAIQYMAQKIATVASPIGFDLTHWAHEHNILFASSENEWESQIRRLILDSSIRTKIQDKGYLTVKKYYDPEYNSAKIINALCS